MLLSQLLRTEVSTVKRKPSLTTISTPASTRTEQVKMVKLLLISSVFWMCTSSEVHPVPYVLDVDTDPEGVVTVAENSGSATH